MLTYTEDLNSSPFFLTYPSSSNQGEAITLLSLPGG